MAKRRLTRREIKQPDQFVSYSIQVIDWTKKHVVHLLYGALGIIVVISLLIGGSAWQRKRRQQAESLLYEAVTLLDTEEKTASLLDPGKAMEQLQKITRDYSNTPAAALAHWHLGHLHFERSDYTAALTAYEQAQRLLPNGQQLLPALVTLNVGNAQVAIGACGKAIASFEAVLQSSADWLHGEAFLGIGSCYENGGERDKALDIYERALSDETVTGAIRQKIEARQVSLRPPEKTLKESEEPTATSKKP